MPQHDSIPSRSYGIALFDVFIDVFRGAVNSSAHRATPQIQHHMLTMNDAHLKQAGFDRKDIHNVRVPRAK